jgi:copper transport protein
MAPSSHPAPRRNRSPPLSPAERARSGLGPPTTVLGVRRALIGFAITIAALVLLAAPAGAHAVLIQTEPASGQVYPTAPRVIALRFDENVQVGLGGIRLFDSKSHRIETGRPSQAGSAATVSVTLPKLANGTYVATWRVISGDGHPVQGAFTFSVGEVTSGGPSAQNLANQLLTSQQGSRVVGVLNGAIRFVEFAATGIMLGGFVFVALCWPSGRRSRAAVRLLQSAWVTAFVGAIAAVLIESSYTAGLGLADSVKPSVVRDYVDTHVGHVMVIRIFALIAVAVLGRGLLRRASLGAARAGLGLVLGVGLLATFTFAGHARTGFQVPLAIVTDLAHLCAFSVWFGGLVVMVVAVLRPHDPSEVESAVPRFSNLALGAVVVLTGTGIYQGWRQVGSLGALKSTTYGRLLLVKVALVVVVVVVAALSRDVIRQHMRDDEPDEFEEQREPLPVGPGAARADLDVEARADTVRRLRFTVGLEVVFLVAVLATTALLVNAAPARTAINAPFNATLQGKGLTFEVLFVPARTGPNEMHLTTLKSNGVLANVLGLEADLSNPAKGIAPIKVTLIKLGPGHYTSNGLALPFSGKWQLEIKALVTDIDEVDVTTTVPVRS